MSERAIAFVEEWVSENVDAEIYESNDDESKAAVYAVQCAAEAKEAGIPDAELIDAFPSLGLVQELSLRTEACGLMV